MTDKTEDREKPDGPDGSGLKFSEILSLMMQLNNRIDTLWQRMLYTHAAIVGVMVFFATSPDLFPIARFLVFFFYSINALITHFAFADSYNGLQAAVRDMRQFEGEFEKSAVQTWIIATSYDRHIRRRALILGVVWLVLSYLLIYPILF